MPASWSSGLLRVLPSMKPDRVAGIPFTVARWCLWEATALRASLRPFVLLCRYGCGIPQPCFY